MKIESNKIDVDNLRIMYHGTNPRFIQSIVRDGLKPRSMTGKSNWNEVPEFISRADMVYLTYCYAAYFSVAANNGLTMAVVEVDITKLDRENFYPDEDVIAQATAKINKLKLRDTHKIIRAQLDQLKDRWKDSIRAMGTFAHKGLVPPDAITRYVIIDLRKVLEKGLFWAAIDPTITIMNFLFRGEWYRHFTEWLFGDREVHPQYAEMSAMQKDFPKLNIGEQLEKLKVAQIDRTGITVVNCNNNISKNKRASS